MRKILFILYILNVSVLSAQQVEWAVSEPYPSYVTRVNTVVHDNFGNTFISGRYNFGTDYKIFIIKYNSAGIKQWQKVYNDGTGVIGLCTDISGNLYTTMFAMTIEGVSYTPNSDVLFTKYDPNGNMLWIKPIKMYMRLSEHTDAQNSIIMTGAVVDTVNLGNGFILSAPPGEDRLFIAKFNTNGDCIWAQQNDGGKYPLLCTSNGDMYAKAELYGQTLTVGQGNNQITLNPADGEQYVARYNSAGPLIWVKQDDFSCIAPDNNGNLYSLIPDVSNTPQNSHRNLYLTKYDSNGNILWKRTHLFSPDWYKFTMKCNANGDIYFTGGFTNYLTIDSTTINDGGNTRTFVAKIDSSGTLKWITVSSGTGGCGAKDITIANGNEIYITGDMGGGENIFGDHTINQAAGVFAVKIIDNEIVSTAIGKPALTTSSTLNVFPNPGSSLITISFSSNKTDEKYEYHISNALGQTIYSDSIAQFSGTYSRQLNLSAFPKGNYYITLYSNSNRNKIVKEVKKIVLQ
ncbi:MAG: T9SS type A sorting domain-containing protein [Bacteroidia bacterium]